MDFYRELLKHPEIRDYLSEFPEPLWSRAVSSTLKYAIFSLKALYPATLTVEMLDAVLDRAKVFLSIEDLLPSMQMRVEGMKDKLKMLDRELGSYQESPGMGSPRKRNPGSPWKESPRKGGLRLRSPEYKTEPPSFGMQSAEGVSQGTQTDKVKRSRNISAKTAKHHPEQAVLVTKDSRVPQKLPKENTQTQSYESRPPPQKRPQKSTLKPPTPAQRESSNWVGDFTSVIRNQDPVPPPTRRPFHSAGHSSNSGTEDSHNTSEASLSKPDQPLMPHWHEASSMSDSSMSAYQPAEDLRNFYRGVYDTLLESRGRQSDWSSSSSQPQRFGDEPYRTY